MFTQHVPMIIPAFTDRPVSALSCRDHFCIALVAGDGVSGWGSADQGQLGEEGRTHGLIAVLFEAHASSGSRFLSGARDANNARCAARGHLSAERGGQRCMLSRAAPRDREIPDN